MAAAAEADFQSASRSFERLGRAARQCMALSARLEREQVADARAHVAAETKRQDAEAAEQVRRATGRAVRLIWTEAEGPEAEDLEDELNLRLEREIEAGALESETVQELVERLCAGLGLGRVQAKLHPAGPRPPAPPEAPGSGPGASPLPPLERDYWNSC